jgi:hypothetical protein
VYTNRFFLFLFLMCLTLLNSQSTFAMDKSAARDALSAQLGYVSSADIEAEKAHLEELWYRSKLKDRYVTTPAYQPFNKEQIECLEKVKKQEDPATYALVHNFFSLNPPKGR